MTATAQILLAPPVTDPFTDLPAIRLADHWRFPPGVVPGVAGQLPEAVLFDSTGVHPSLAAQLKWTIATRCLRHTWRAQNLRAIRTIVKRIVGFLRADARLVTSVLDRDLDEWQLHLRSYLIASGAYRPETHSHLTRFALGEVKQYQREDPTIRVFRLLCAMVVEELDPRQEYDKDVWSLRRLGISGRFGARQSSHLHAYRAAVAEGRGQAVLPAHAREGRRFQLQRGDLHSWSFF